jgi:hypothetical protein
MYCRKCGAPNDDSALKCAGCGEALGPALSAHAPSARVPNHLAWAIVTAILCCMPLSFVALWFATQVDQAVALGERDRALDLSRKAKTWCWVSFGVALVGWVCYLALVLVGVFTGFWD